MSIDGVSINEMFKVIKDGIFNQECEIPKNDQAEAIQLTNQWQSLISDYLAEQNSQNMNTLSSLETIASPSSLTSRQIRLKKKHEARKSELEAKFLNGIMDICLSQINSGITKIKKREEAEKARQAAEKSLLETPTKTNTRSRKKGKRKKKASQIAPTPPTPVSQKKDKEVEKPNVPDAPIFSPEEKKQLFFSNLSHQVSGWRQHSRVSRWKNLNLDSIRLFCDRGMQRYKNHSNALLNEIRAKHYLPGTEKLLNAPYANIYTCKTDSGFGMVAKFVYNGKSQAGMLYLGCDRKCIYHRFFEEVDFTNKETFFTENADETVTANKQSTVAITPDSTEVQIKEENGIIEFKYADYSLFIYPIHEELLERELTDYRQ